MKMYFDGLGYRDTVKDKNDIIWYFEQIAKTKTGRNGEETKYWLNLREWYGEKLLKHEAYEVLEFIKIKATDAKVKRREMFREKSKIKAEKEMKHLKSDIDQWSLRRQLTKDISAN